MRRSQRAQKEGANREQTPALNIVKGLLVWPDAIHVQNTRLVRMFDWKQLRPLEVLQQIYQLAYEFKLPASEQIHQVQLVSLLDSVVDDLLAGPLGDPPPPGGS